LSGQHAARHSETEDPPGDPRQDAPKRRRNIIAATSGAVVAALLVVVAVTTLNLGPAKPAASDAAPVADRTTGERADRAGRSDPSATPSASAEPLGVDGFGAAPSKSPTPSPTPSKKPPSKKATPSPSKKAAGSSSSGNCEVSFYADGGHTADGENFDPDGLTAAHKTLPFNTMVKVTNLANGKSVTVRINDRGPFVSGRCLDLARGAFTKIASTGAGVIDARYEVLK
jgi:rare lipoprotein A